MTTFEYDIVELGFNFHKEPDRFESLLNRKGSNGWRLLESYMIAKPQSPTLVSSGKLSVSTVLLCIFERGLAD